MENKVVVITGGAGQVGYATAKRFASKGARVILIVRSKVEQAKQLVLQLPNQSLQHMVIKASVDNEQEMHRAATEVKTVANRCDVLVNAAGVSIPSQSPLQTTEKILQESFDINVKGTMFAIQQFYSMLKQSNGVVVNISSMAAYRTRPNSLAYSACKAAVNSMTECFAKSMGPDVRFVAIAPSSLTNPTSGQFRMSPERTAMYKDSIPLKRIPTGEDVADAIESLVCNIKFFNGHVLVLDGGVLL